MAIVIEFKPKCSYYVLGDCESFKNVDRLIYSRNAVLSQKEHHFIKFTLKWKFVTFEIQDSRETVLEHAAFDFDQRNLEISYAHLHLRTGMDRQTVL